MNQTCSDPNSIDYFFIHLNKYENGQFVLSKDNIISFGYIYW